MKEKVMGNSKKINIVIILIICIILIDQTSKILAINYADNQGVICWNPNIETKKIENVVSSLFTDFVIFIIIIKFLKEQDKNMDMKIKISLALILGGGLSNFIDKIWNKGNVINFIKFGRMPTINLAYIFLIIGWIVFLILMVSTTIRVNNDLKKINEKKKKIGRE